MFTGLSAFPLTPLRDGLLDERAYAELISRLASAGVDSITALGSTGAFAYLSGEQRDRVARLAVERAGETPVFVGIGALSTAQVLERAEGAERAGAAALLLPAMSYLPLTENDVFELYRTVTSSSSLPVILYDNPGTTHFAFSIELYARIAQLPGIASIKIPAVPLNPDEARARVSGIREAIPSNVTIGISGDGAAATGLVADCDAWYSVIGGTLPELALPIVRAAQQGRSAHALAESERLAPLWALFAEAGGGARVVAAIAEQLGLAQRSCLPLPVQGLADEQRARVAQVIEHLKIGATS